MISLPENEFKARLQREAAKAIKDRFGCTPDELEARLSAPPAAAAPVAGGAPAAAAAPAPAPGGNSDLLAKLRRENDTLKGRVDVLKGRNEKIRARARGRLVELTIKHEALAVGIAEDHAEFALEQYRKAVRTSEAPPDARPFFAGLKDKMPYLFVEGAPTVPLAPTTAGPTGSQPGGAAPTPIPAGQAGGTPGKSVDDMTDAEFKTYRESKYGRVRGH